MASASAAVYRHPRASDSDLKFHGRRGYRMSGPMSASDPFRRSRRCNIMSEIEGMNRRNADIAILYSRAYVVLKTAITVNHRMDAWACPSHVRCG
jgi:hypothetical protein